MLVALDLVGLVLRPLRRADLPRALPRRVAAALGDPLETETDWLPFLTVITVLVFWVGGLYRRRESRSGVGQIVFSLMLVALITLAFGLGTGYHFTTYGLTPTALVLTALFIALLRSSYDVLTRDVLQLAGVRRRAVLVGEGEQLDEAPAHARLGPQRHPLRVPRRGRAGRRHRRPAVARRPRRSCRSILREQRRARADRRPTAASARTSCSSSSKKRTATACASRSRRARRSCCCSAPSTSRARACRSSSCGRRRLAGWEWGVKRGFDIVVSTLRDRRRLAAVGGDRLCDQAHLARAGVLPRPAHRSRRSAVRDDEVPDDVRRRGGAPGRARGGRTRRRGRCSRSRTTRVSRASAASCAASRSTSCRRC